MLLITHPDCLEHRMQPGHMERPDRLRALLDFLGSSGLLTSCTTASAPLVDWRHIQRVHQDVFLQRLQRLSPRTGLTPLDPDTAMGPRTLDAARRAAGAVVEATRQVMEGTHRRAFCAVRPPGHHAESGAAMGFCFINSVCVAARYALDELGAEKIAILDFDVHHGNGSVEIMLGDPRVLVCSSYQWPFYPGRYDRGSWPNVVLTPLEAGTGGTSFRQHIEADWITPVRQHRPDLILVSAGFDAHHADPLGGLNLDEDDFRWITRLIVELAEEAGHGRVVSALEGGYDLKALATSAAAHVEVML
jgi:acetoin utilization deacetylase AcuC-like enzyme